MSISNRKVEGRKPVDAAVLSISEVMGLVKKMGRVDLKRQKKYQLQHRLRVCGVAAVLGLGIRLSDQNVSSLALGRGEIAPDVTISPTLGASHSPESGGNAVLI